MERKQDCTHIDHNQLGDSLPFTIIWTNILIFLSSIMIGGHYLTCYGVYSYSLVSLF